MAKRKDNYPSNVWEYTDWLYTSGRLTAEEHLKLKVFLLELDKQNDVAAADCGNCDGCEQGYGCEYPAVGC